MGIICCTKMLVMWSVFDLKKKGWCLLVILNSDFAFNLKQNHSWEWQVDTILFFQ